MWGIIVGLIALAPKSQRVVADLDSKIIGGFELDLRRAPFLASLQIRGNHFCGGAILTQSHIITGCHCLSKIDIGMRHDDLSVRYAKYLTVVAGEENIKQPKKSANYQRREVNEVQIHPNCSYIEYLEYDFAIAYLKQPLMKTPKVKPFKIYWRGKKAYDQETRNLVGSKDKFCYVAGWGATEPKSDKPAVSSPMLKAARMAIIPDAECKRKLGQENTKFSDYDFMSHGQMCAMSFGRKNESDCVGDSGGPFFCGSAVYGIVSYGYDCGIWDSPSVYAKVSYAIEWLTNLQLTMELGSVEERNLKIRRAANLASPINKLRKPLLLLAILCTLFSPASNNKQILLSKK